MEDNRFYVYALLDPREMGEWILGKITVKYKPFYIGKGTGKRDNHHLYPSSLKCKNSKNSKILAIKNTSGLSPIICRIVENVTEDEALSKEVELINQLGRKDLKSGILCNLTDGGDGVCNILIDPIQRHHIEIFQYDVSGLFLKKWSSITEAANTLKLNLTNIKTSIKRGGTCQGFIWSYEYNGLNIKSRIIYKMPCKHTNIRQIDIISGEVLTIYENIGSVVRTNNFSHNKILDCLNGKLKSAYGYFWSTSDDFIIPNRKNNRAVLKLDVDGNVIWRYSSIRQAEKDHNFSKGTIWAICNGKKPQSTQYKWEYEKI